MISGFFQACGLESSLNDSLNKGFGEKKLSLNGNIKLTLGGRTLSIAMDNSCGAGRTSSFRNSISLEENRVHGQVVDDPDDSTLTEALLWLVKGTPCELSKDLELRSL